LEITKEKLDNGLSINHIKLPFGRSQYFGFWVKTGSSFENSKKYYGISHYLEHMLFNGSKNYPDGPQVQKDLASYGIIENAWTFYSITHYFMISPLQSFKKGFDILHDRVVNPLLNEEMTKKEKGIILEERKMTKSDPESVLDEKISSAAFKGTNYGHPVIGYEDTISGITPQLLKQYHQTFYSPGNMMFLSYGPMEYTEVRSNVFDKLAAIKTDKSLAQPNLLAKGEKQNVPDFSPQSVEIGFDVKTDFYGAIARLPQIESIEDYIAYLLFEIMLAGGEASFLNIELELKRSLASSYNVSIYPERGFCLMDIGASMESEKRQDCLRVIKRVFKKLLNSDFSDKDFERARNYAYGFLLRNYENVWANYDIDLSNVFGLNFLSELDFTPPEIAEAMKEIKMKKVVSVWRENISLENLVEGVVVAK
jgi:predicted Zn-dependent peptidase